MTKTILSKIIGGGGSGEGGLFSCINEPIMCQSFIICRKEQKKKLNVCTRRVREYDQKYAHECKEGGLVKSWNLKHTYFLNGPLINFKNQTITYLIEMASQQQAKINRLVQTDHYFLTISFLFDSSKAICITLIKNDVTYHLHV